MFSSLFQAEIGQTSELVGIPRSISSVCYFKCIVNELEKYVKHVINLIIYKRQCLHSDWLRACQLIPNQCKKVKLSAKR